MAYKVFLVDDDRYVRKGLINLIDWEGCGFEVCAEADNGEDALLYIREYSPELVITDIKMPVLDGLELIKHALDLENSISNFIIITGYSDFKYAQKAVKYGVHDFILKPVDKDELEGTLKKVADGHTKKLQSRRNKENTLATAAFNDLIAGEIDQGRLNECMMNLNINRAIGIVYIIIEINNSAINTIKTRETIRKAVHDDELNPTVLFREHGNNQIGLLLKSENVQRLKTSIFSFSGNLKNQLSKCLNVDVTVYVGEIANNAAGIKESYETAVKVSQFKYVEKYDEPIVYGHTKNTSVNYIELDHGLYQMLLEKIEENKTYEIEKITDSMFEQFQIRAFAKNAVRTSINRVIHEVIRTVQFMNGDEKNLLSLRKILNWDNLPCTLLVIKDMFLAFLLEAAAMLNQLNKECGDVNIRRIKKHIDTHYQEDLTLKNIANKFFLNPVYMGQLFKKTYGMYFKDYVLQVRISEAKRKLRQTDMRIFQVAESVGFSNSDYFIIQFERVTGMTPTQYRKKL